MVSFRCCFDLMFKGITVALLFNILFVKGFTIRCSFHKSYFKGLQNLKCVRKFSISSSSLEVSRLNNRGSFNLFQSSNYERNFLYKDNKLKTNALIELEDTTNPSPRGPTQKYIELIGIYDADGSVMGEIKYIYNKVFKNKHCSLCDITHGSIKEKGEFKACKARLPIPLRTIHLDEQDDDLRRFTSINICVPCVVGRKTNDHNNFDIVLNNDDLQSCDKSVDRFEKLLRQRLEMES